MDDAESTDITLAFELAALRRLSNPQGVVTDARYWTSSIGLVTDESTPVVRKFARDNSFNPDFLPGSRDKRSSLVKVINQPEHEADRYILVAVDESIRERAEEVGWEFLTVEEAAETAGWTVTVDEDDDDGDHTGWP